MALLAVFCAVRMITTKNPVHAALWLVGNFVSLGVIFLMLSAPVLFAVQLIVYAGAIMVLFLFVIMFFMSPRARQYLRPPLRSQQAIGGVLAITLISMIVVALAKNGEQGVPILDNGGNYDATSAYAQGISQEGSTMGSAKALSVWLFQYDVLPFELTGILLLAALLGAMMVARDEVGEGRRKIAHYAPVLHPEDEFPTDPPEETEAAREGSEVAA